MQSEQRQLVLIRLHYVVLGISGTRKDRIHFHSLETYCVSGALLDLEEQQ